MQHLASSLIPRVRRLKTVRREEILYRRRGDAIVVEKAI